MQEFEVWRNLRPALRGVLRRAWRGTLHGVAGALLVLAAGLGRAHADAQVVSAVELREEGKGLRLSVESSGVMPFRIFQLEAPDRVIADFRIAHWTAPPIADEELPDEAAGLRFGLFRPGIGRLVLELDTPMRLDAVELIGGKVEMRLRPTTRAAFAAGSGWPEGARWEPGLDRLPAPQGSGPILVAIDPGHGGVDPGAIVAGVVEKRIALTFAEELAQMLIATGHYRVVLTRDRDIYVPLGERVRRARAAGANLILSIHADVVTEGDARGSTVYTLLEDRAATVADRLVERERRVDILMGADFSGSEDALARVLVDLAQRSTLVESRRLAKALVSEFARSTGVIASRPHREAGFMVLRAPDTPSVLIELGFLTSASDRAKLQSLEWRARAAGAVVRALGAWAAEATPDFLRPREL